MHDTQARLRAYAGSYIDEDVNWLGDGLGAQQSMKRSTTMTTPNLRCINQLQTVDVKESEERLVTSLEGIVKKSLREIVTGFFS